MYFTVDEQERARGSLTATKLAEVLAAIEERGFAVLAGVISADTCERLAEAILEDTARVRAAGQRTQHEERTGVGHLQLGLRRYAPWVSADLVANPLIECVVAGVLGEGAWLGFYNGNVNCPGSTHQPVHFDRPFSWTSAEAAARDGERWPPPPTTLSCSVALQAITRENGPTDIWPGSHHETAVIGWPRGTRVSEHPELLASWGDPEQMTIPAGGVCLRDPRMWHRGVPNPGDTPRPMMAVTYHSRRGRHWRGLLQPNLEPSTRARLEADSTLRVLDSGDLGDGRLVFHESARPAFEASPNLHGVNRNVRFVDDPLFVNHFLDAHLTGGARIVEGRDLQVLPAATA